MEYVDLVLVTYYLVAMCTRTDGPFGIFYRLRQHQSLPFYCHICLAPWAALAAFLTAFYLPDAISTVLAVAGAAVALHDATDKARQLLQ